MDYPWGEDDPYQLSYQRLKGQAYSTMKWQNGFHALKCYSFHLESLVWMTLGAKMNLINFRVKGQ
jgi:hypothetical protein